MKRFLPVLLLLAACATGGVVDIPTATAASPETRFDLFVGNERHLVDSVRVARDTLFADSISVNPSAPRTQVAVPVGAVDSLRVAHTDRAALTSALLPGVVMVGIAAVIALAWGSD